MGRARLEARDMTQIRRSTDIRAARALRSGELPLLGRARLPDLEQQRGGAKTY